MGKDYSAKTKRLGIFFFYDAEGKADRYIDIYLKGMKEVLSELVIVCNGKITPESRDLFKHYSDRILVRENKGFDVWAYKEAIDYVGWKKLRTFYEVVLFNFTLMGPVFPVSEMFDKMSEQTQLDFWGLSAHEKIDLNVYNNKFGYIPKHIQSSFIVYRQSFLKSRELEDYWNNIPEINSYEDSIGLHESYFTKFFSDQGFRWDSYIKNKKGDPDSDFILMQDPVNALKEQRSPFFKRRVFFQDQDYYSQGTMGEKPIELFRYLKQETGFDTAMITENIIRTCHQIDFVRTMALRYILPTDYAVQRSSASEMRVAAVAHLYFQDLFEDSLHYLSMLPDNADIYITTPHKADKEKIEKIFSVLPNKVEVRLIENRGRDVSSLLVGAADIMDDYDLICFYHDKKTSQVRPASQGRSFAYKMSEGVLHNKNYVNNVIHKFEENPYLGLLTPMPPNTGHFYFIMGHEWTSNFEITKKLCDELNLHVPLDEKSMPVAPLGTTFWFRARAMRKLFRKKWKYTDFPAEPNKNDGTLLHGIERVYPFVVQDAGFYPAYVMPDYLGAMEINNLYHYLSSLNKILFAHGIGGTGLQTSSLLENCLDERNALLIELERCRREIEKLIPQTRFFVAIRLRIKKYLPKWLYAGILKTKRFLVGPRNIPFSMKEDWE